MGLPYCQTRNSCISEYGGNQAGKECLIKVLKIVIFNDILTDKQQIQPEKPMKIREKRPPFVSLAYSRLREKSYALLFSLFPQ